MPQVTQFPEITRLTSGDKLYVIDAGTTSTQITAGNADQSLSKNRIVNVNSINELINLDVSSIPNGSMVHVKSYYDDYVDRGLGGGHFYWSQGSSATEDSGRYFKSLGNPSAAGRWERLLNGAMANVMMWGAKGNSNFYTTTIGADDTKPIKNALSGCRYGWSSKLYFPSCVYKITDTLIWDAQQTHIIGDGCVNGTIVMMDTGIQKNLMISYGFLAYEEHNANPSEATLVSHLTNDIPKMEKICLAYAGAYHRDLITAERPLHNNTNSILSLTLPGETNLIDNVYFEGGKYGIRIIGPQGPGLRLTNSTIAAQGEAAISLEANISKKNPPTWNYVTGEGAGMLTVDNCSSDYRGTNITGYSFIKVHNGASPSVTIKDLKIEGLFPSGIVNYVHGFDGSYGSVTIDGLFFNQTESTGVGYPVLYPSTVVAISPLYSGMKNSVYCNLKNLTLYGVEHVIRDHILSDINGKPYIIYPSVGRAGGLDQTQSALSPITHFGQRQPSVQSGQSFYTKTNFLLNNQPDELVSYFEPSGATQSGWYRIMEGNLSNSAVLNYNLSLSNFYEVHKLNIFSDNATQTADIRSVSSKTNGYDIITKARVFHSSVPRAVNGVGDTTYAVYCDIFVNPTWHLFADEYRSARGIRVHLERMNSPHSNESNQSNLVVPTYLGISGIPYESAAYKYHEVDLTRQHDRSHTYQMTRQAIGSTLLQKDIHLFTNSARDVRLFDAGATVTFTDGGASTNAQGRPIFTNGALTNIVLSNTGAGYTSFPTITISPITAGNGSAAFASGQFSPGGGIIRVHVISGGSNYSAGPYYDTDGYSLTGVIDNSVTTSKILNSAVTTAKIADSNVTTVKIADANITYAKIATSAVSGSNIADNGISGSKIVNGAITLAKLDASVPSGLSKLITSDSVSSSVRRLIIQNNPSAPTTQVLITADEIVLKNNSGQSYLANSPIINLNIDGSVGAGGLDASPKANNTWYGIWGIYNSGSNLTSGVLSRADGRNFNYLGTSSSDATWGFGPVMPGTYTYKALLGHAYHKVAAFDTFLTQDRRTYINDTVLFKNGASNVSNTYQFYQTGLGGVNTDSRSLTGVIPRNSIKLYGNFGSGPDEAYSSIGAIAATSGGLGACISVMYPPSSPISTTGSQNMYQAGTSYEIPLTGWGFWWKNNVSSTRSIISVNGYEI